MPREDKHDLDKLMLFHVEKPDLKKSLHRFSHNRHNHHKWAAKTPIFNLKTVFLLKIEQLLLYGFIVDRWSNRCPQRSSRSQTFRSLAADSGTRNLIQMWISAPVYLGSGPDPGCRTVMKLFLWWPKRGSGWQPARQRDSGKTKESAAVLLSPGLRRQIDHLDFAPRMDACVPWIPTVSFWILPYSVSVSFEIKWEYGTVVSAICSMFFPKQSFFSNSN